MILVEITWIYSFILGFYVNIVIYMPLVTIVIEILNKITFFSTRIFTQGYDWSYQTNFLILLAMIG